MERAIIAANDGKTEIRMRAILQLENEIETLEKRNASRRDLFALRQRLEMLKRPIAGAERRDQSALLSMPDASAPSSFNVDGKSLEGYAVKFNQLSRDLGGFREVFLPGAFKKVLAEKNDVIAVVNHDENKLLGRRSAKTLDVFETPQGLFYRVALPDTGLGRDTAYLVNRGDISGSSFSFRVLRDRFVNDSRGYIREVIEARALGDVSPVTIPAYPSSSVSLTSNRLYRSATDLNVETARRRLTLLKLKHATY